MTAKRCPSPHLVAALCGAVIEFEKVFTFPATDKDDDAQLKLGHCHRSMGNIDKAREEYQRLIDYFPGSEFYEKAKESIKQLNI